MKRQETPEIHVSNTPNSEAVDLSDLVTHEQIVGTMLRRCPGHFYQEYLREHFGPLDHPERTIERYLTFPLEVAKDYVYQHGSEKFVLQMTLSRIPVNKIS